MQDPETKKFYCEDSRCVKGIFTPKVCRDHRCAVLFASDFSKLIILNNLDNNLNVLITDTSRFAIDQIIAKSMFVQIVWLGPNLNKDFVKRNLDLGTVHTEVEISCGNF